MTTPIGFDQLRAQITPTQQEILSSIWRHFRAKKQWVLTRVTHHEFGKSVVLGALKPLGGMIVREVCDVGNQRYQLTLLGILLTDQSEEILDSIERYLGYIKKRYLTDPENDSVNSREILSQGTLTEEQVHLLGWVLTISPFWGGSFGGSDGDWSTQFPRDVDEFPAIDDFRSHIKKRIIEQYNREVPISEAERVVFSDVKTNEIRAAKERDQKFGILLSPKQAKLDFDQWAGELPKDRSEIAVLFIDIDNFKLLNTEFTETRVDATILPDFMHLLNDLCVKRGEAYQQGGDEFLVILPNHTPAESSVFGERLLSRVAEQTFLINDAGKKLTVSVGVAHWPQNGRSYEDVLLRANEAKKEAKKTKNCVKVIGFEERKESVGSASYTLAITLTPIEPQPIPRHKLLDQLIASSYSLPLNDFGRRMRWPLYRDRSNLVQNRESGWIGAKLHDEQDGMTEYFEISHNGKIRFIHTELYLGNRRVVSCNRVLKGLLDFWPFLHRFSRTKPGSYEVSMCIEGIREALLSVDISLVFAKDWLATVDRYETASLLSLPTMATLECNQFLLQMIHAVCSSFSPSKGVSIADFKEDYINSRAEKFLATVVDASREDE